MAGAGTAHGAEPVHELRVARGPETVYTLSATALWLGIEASAPLWAPEACKWCAPPALDRKVRDALKVEATSLANVSSYGTAALAPFIVFGGLGLSGAAHGGGTFWTDVMITSEAAATTMLVTNLFKGVVGRERPFVQALDERERREREPSSDDNLSFFSGHTSFTFALATAGGTVAWLRGYEHAPYVWAAGLGMAGLTGYLRIAADRHYFTDVLTGAVVGSAFGVGMPLLLHGRTRSAPRLSLAPLPLSGARGLAIYGVF